MNPQISLQKCLSLVNSRPGLLFIVSGPSGVGKSLLCSHTLKEVPDLIYSISFTTRAPRPHEEKGKDYYFISHSEFQEKINQGEFLEYAYVHGNFYGSSQKKIQEVLQQGRDVILDIDVQGAKQLNDKKTLNSVLIFIIPLSISQLQARLLQRGTNSAEEVAERLKNAAGEIIHYKHYNYLVVNDDFKLAAAALKSIIIAERCRPRKT